MKWEKRQTLDCCMYTGYRQWVGFRCILKCPNNGQICISNGYPDLLCAKSRHSANDEIIMNMMDSLSKMNYLLVAEACRLSGDTWRSCCHARPWWLCCPYGSLFSCWPPRRESLSAGCLSWTGETRLDPCWMGSQTLSCLKEANFSWLLIHHVTGRLISVITF